MNINEMRILIVDDFNSMRSIVKSILKDLHYSHIDEAENGETALKMLNKKSYDLVLTDWNMPYMSGLDLLKAIRKDERLSHIPVLMLTSEAKKQNVIDAAKEGASGYIVKPFNAATLHQKIKSSSQQIQLKA